MNGGGGRAILYIWSLNGTFLKTGTVWTPSTPYRYRLIETSLIAAQLHKCLRSCYFPFRPFSTTFQLHPTFFTSFRSNISLFSARNHPKLVQIYVRLVSYLTLNSRWNRMEKRDNEKWTFRFPSVSAEFQFRNQPSTTTTLFFWSETFLGWFSGERNGNITLAVTLTPRSLPKSNGTI